MKKEYSWLWMAWLGASLMLDFIEVERGVALPWWTWMLLVVYFVIVEGVAINRVKAGDTLSEFWWALISGGPPARLPLALGFGVFITLHFLNVSGASPLPLWYPRAALALGVLLFFSIHMIYQGEKG